MPRKKGPPPTSATRRLSLDPGTLRIAEQAVEDAWQELVNGGSPAATERGKKVVCELMAQRVFSQASHGERDLQRLKECALAGLLNALGE